MHIKRVLRPERLRRIPAQFSWIDQRLVRERYVEGCDVHALALYLFLLTVGDAQGLSYYADVSSALGSSPTRHRCIRCYPSIRPRPRAAAACKQSARACRGY